MENNNEQIKLCPACGAQNKAVYQYCNECGEPLNRQAEAPQNSCASGVNYTSQPNYNAQPNNEQPSHTAQPNYGNHQQNPYYGTNTGGYSNQQTYTPPPYQSQNSTYPNSIMSEVEATPDFDGVSATEVYDFTGRKIELFRKLRDQHLRNGSGPYCWPLFILGITLGFFGMGCWYLYHKLYKPAIGLFAVAVVNLGVSIAVCWSMFGEMLKIMPDCIGDIVGNNTDAVANTLSPVFLEKILPVTMIGSAFSLIIGIASLTLTIVLPFSAYKLYKNYALKKINESKMVSAPTPLTTVGGSRGGLVAVVSVLWGIVNIASIVALMIWFSTQTLTLINDYLEENGYPDSYYYEDYYEDNYNDYNELPFGDDFDPFADFDY